MGLFVCFLVLVLTDPSPPLRVHSWSSPTPLLLSAFIPVLVGPQVDLPAALAKTEWGALVRPSTKWSEKKQAIDIAVAAIGATPKLKVQKSALLAIHWSLAACRARALSLDSTRPPRPFLGPQPPAWCVLAGPVPWEMYHSGVPS